MSIYFTSRPVLSTQLASSDLIFITNCYIDGKIRTIHTHT